jgi:hypothetical protein
MPRLEAPAFVAQRIEHLTTDQKVGGSSPSKRTELRTLSLLTIQKGKVMKVKKLAASFTRKVFARLKFPKFNSKSNQEIFSRIYKNKIWGTSEKDDLPFNSGGGSVEAEVVDPYIMAVQKFVAGIPSRITAVELGCGDFRVSSRIVNLFDKFIACDVVKDLIEFNREHYRNLPVEFQLLDMTNGPIPPGDMLIVRQVLQHLSNEDISRFLKLIPKQFGRLLITEHIPAEKNFQANLNKKTGADIRLPMKSGVVLTKRPFNLIVKDQKTLLSLPQDGGLIVTTVYKI